MRSLTPTWLITAWPGWGSALLVPMTAAFTLGIVLDRYLNVPLGLALLASLVLLAIWTVQLPATTSNVSRIALGLACFGVGCGYHHAWRQLYPPDHIAYFLPERPVLVRVRATLRDEPFRSRGQRVDPMISIPRTEPTIAVIEFVAIEQGLAWVPLSGKARLIADGDLPSLHGGDVIECTGWLARPASAANPGEWDAAEQLRDQRILVQLHVRKSAEGIVRLEQGWRSSVLGWLGVIRSWGQRCIQERIPEPQAGVAMALLLGESPTMSRADWDKYIRTGVIHVLAISGQHLVVLAMFGWFAARLVGLRRRQVTWLIGGVLIVYAILTGGRPSAIRAAIMVSVGCLGIWFRRPVLPANTYALAWLMVLLIQPTDLFTAGFQLSFLAVAVLIWGIPQWFPPHEPGELDRLIEESRSFLEQMVRAFLRIIAWAYLISAILGVTTAPQVMFWQNLVSPLGILLGPPLIFLTSLSLIAGFLLFIVVLVSDWAALPLAWIITQSIRMCGYLVDTALQWPGMVWYTGAIPTWWLVGFDAILGFWLMRPHLLGGKLSSTGATPAALDFLPQRRFLAVSLGWAVCGLLLPYLKGDPDELRVSVLAVGHGCCTVLETLDGRVILYDAGSLAGPEVAARRIAPFLWHRGIHRIDELYLSHADLDHFNGVLGLAERFRIGQVIVTKSFFEKRVAGVIRTEEALHQRGIPIRLARAGDVIDAGDIQIEVLHPPDDLPGGTDDNPRSMVLRIVHGKRTILLTGDLVQPGLDRFLRIPDIRADVLLAPHHGSNTSNIPELAERVRPRLVIASEELREEPTRGEQNYLDRGIPFWSTATQGCITLHSHRSGMFVESFRSSDRLVIPARR